MRARRLLLCVGLLCAAWVPRAAGSTTIHLTLSLRIAASGETPYVLDEAALAEQLAEAARLACDGLCNVTAGDVRVDQWDASAAPVYVLAASIQVPDMSTASGILPSSATVQPPHDIRWWLSTALSNRTLLGASETAVTGAHSAAGAGARPVQCGDNVQAGAEQCDDGNTADGDGCSATCQFEPGFMCTHHWRDALAGGAPGTFLHVFAANASFALDAAAGAEACSGPAVCARGALWRPENWVAKYAAGVALPPRGFYCGKFCASFPAPVGYVFDDNCELADKNECSLGTAVCDYNAYCLNQEPAPSNSGRGYSCQCDETFFATAVNGLGCTPAGVEIVVVVGGKKAFDSSEDPPPDRAVMEALRGAFIDALIADGYTTAAGSRAVLLESLLGYPVELVGISSAAGFAGRALWEMRVRISSMHANYAVISAGTLLRSAPRMRAIFDDAAGPDSDAHRLHSQRRCANDFARSCAAGSDCLQGAACLLDVPDVLWGAVEGSHAASSIRVASSGFSLVSVDYDSAESAWRARVRFDDTVPGVMNVLYLPHITPPVSATERATFRPDEFPCLPVGTGAFQQRRDDSLCCLATVAADYTTVNGFAAYLADSSLPLAQAMAAGAGACAGGRPPPANTSKALLDTARDFVAGPFARMTRSHAALDPVATRGYRDVLLYLAEEDMRNLGGIESTIDGGYNLRFFVGMAHLRGLESSRLHASFSHVEVTADVTQAYVFSSSAQTDYTFIRDVNVNLIEVKRRGGGPALKFARVQLTVPVSVVASEATGIIPAASARAASGYSLGSTPSPVYPCVVAPPPPPPPRPALARRACAKLTRRLRTGHVQRGAARRDRRGAGGAGVVRAERPDLRRDRPAAGRHRRAGVLYLSARGRRVDAGRPRPRQQLPEEPLPRLPGECARGRRQARADARADQHGDPRARHLAAVRGGAGELDHQRHCRGRPLPRAH